MLNVSRRLWLNRQPSIAISAPWRAMQSAAHNPPRPWNINHSVLVEQFISVFLDTVIVTGEKGESFLQAYCATHKDLKPKSTLWIFPIIVYVLQVHIFPLIGFSFLQTAISRCALSYSYTGGWAAVSAAQATCDEKRSSVHNPYKLQPAMRSLNMGGKPEYVA